MRQWDSVAIIGVGLIGASIGLALKKRGLAQRIIGIGRNAPRLQEACDQGAVTDFFTDMDRGVADAQLIVVCTPVGHIASHVRQAAAASAPTALLTDAGSTKSQICRELAATPELVARFVGSHPMAGSEKSGARHGRADLFVDRVTVVTPSQDSSPDLASQIEDFWRSLGSRVLRMTPDAHDAAVAAVSHAPHVIASVLAAATPDEHLALAGSGWGDTTRVAAGDAELWRQIVLQNRQPILRTLDEFTAMLAQFRAALDAEDGQQIAHLLELGKRRRDAFAREARGKRSP